MFARSNKKDNKPLVCEYCDTTFAHQSSKSRHIKNCKHRNDCIEDLKVKVKMLTDKVNMLQDNNHSFTNNTTNNNNNIGTINVQNVHLRDFGQENIEYLSDNFISRCFANRDILRLIEIIHCDKQHPENHNVRIRSQKRQQIEIRENARWMVKDEDEALTDLIQNGYRVLVRHGFRHKHNIIKEELDDVEEEYHCIRDWLEHVYDNKNEQKPIKRKLMLLLLSNQALILGKDEDL